MSTVRKRKKDMVSQTLVMNLRNTRIFVPFCHVLAAAICVGWPPLNEPFQKSRYRQIQPDQYASEPSLLLNEKDGRAERRQPNAPR